jgi:Ca2+-transporting ATPase
MEYNFKGLTAQEVERSRKEHGSNVIVLPDVEGFWDKLRDNFKDPMIIILLIALVIVTILAVTGFAAWYEGVGIAAAVALATFVSTASEYKNEQTFQKLQEEASKIYANVFREGHLKQIGIDEIVVGDQILLQPGDKISADGEIVFGELKVNQAMFTGEPQAVLKIPGDAGSDVYDLDDPHLLFRGTTIEDGEAVMQVSRVGGQTQFGKLARDLSVEDREGPLRVKLGMLAQAISKFGYIGASFIALAFISKVVFLDNNFQTDLIRAYFSNWQHALYDITTAAILAVIIIVVAVPEGLPMMIAIVLSQNMRKLLYSNVLVRQLLGIETAGSLNILFCDKTGTITKGQLEVVNFMSLPSPKNPSGRLEEYATFGAIPQKLKELLDLSIRANTSSVVDLSAENERDRIIGGNITGRTLLKFIGAHIQKPIYPENSWRMVKEILFNSTRKFSASQLELQDNRTLSLVKGAPEKILDCCTTYYDKKTNIRTLSEEKKQELSYEMNEKAEEGFRIIAIATSETALKDDESIPCPLTLLGFISIRDTLRDEAKLAIRTLHAAGIQVVMLTGDKLGTAKSVARDVELLFSEKDVMIESSELNAVSDEALKAMLPDLKIIARCLPGDKKRLVKVAQDMGMVVGMTGDGVNDAPALSNADIGFGLGSGSEVAKEASEIVILDDNVRSITNAVHYGRTIYRSIQKFIIFQLTVNVSAILITFLGQFLGYKLPLTMIQLLWINLIMDTLAALAFSGEPPLEKHMQETSKSREETIITRRMWSSILLNGFFIAGFSVFFLKSDGIQSLFYTKESFMTAFFGFFVFVHNFNKFNVRVEELNLFHHISENRGFLRVVSLIFGVQILLTYFGGTMFRTVALQPVEWLYITALSMLIIPFDLIRKLICTNFVFTIFTSSVPILWHNTRIRHER